MTLYIYDIVCTSNLVEYLIICGTHICRHYPVPLELSFLWYSYSIELPVLRPGSWSWCNCLSYKKVRSVP